MVDSWQQMGLTPTDINQLLEVVPYTSQCPAIAGDFEAMALLAADPEFATYKDDPQFWYRLNEQLSAESYNGPLPTGRSSPEQDLTFPDNFSTWGGTSPNLHPFYQQDQAALGRMLAELGGDFDPNYRRRY